MIYDGKNGGTVELLEHFIVIRRQGILSALNQGLKGEKRIPFASITSVQFKEPGITTGYIQSGVLGGRESRGGVLDATQDENTVLFLKKAASDFRELRDIVERRALTARNGDSSVSTPVPSANVGEELTKFADLRDRGVLSEKEFTEQKDRLLGQRSASSSALEVAIPTRSHEKPTLSSFSGPDEPKQMGWGKKLGIGCFALFALFVLLAILGILSTPENPESGSAVTRPVTPKP